MPRSQPSGRPPGFTGAGRYAPSPSGDLHLGNLRTALLAWLFARSSNRSFLIRIEDLDRERDRGTARSQLDDLERFGLDWDGGPVLQTQRGHLYETAIHALIDAGLTYPCTCSRRDIQTAVSAPHAPPGAYPGTCRNRSSVEQERAAQAILPRRPALRFRAPAPPERLEFSDRMLGNVSGDIDDFVLRRGDGTVAYHLAVVVDDSEMGVDQIVRGSDLALSTPRQIMLQRALRLPSPPLVQYVHVPLVLNSERKRLAKRDGAVTLRALEARGITPAQALSWCGRSLGLSSPGEQPEAHTLLERFDPDRLTRTPWIWTPPTV